MSSLRSTISDYIPPFAEEGLNAHNEYRRRHGVPDLILIRELCDSAQECADALAKGGSLSIKHKHEHDYGENTFCATQKSGATPRDAVDSWYSQMKKHKFDTENVKKSLEFTQVIWKSTTDLGIGMARSVNGRVFIVAVYSPKGNQPGEFINNVPRPLSTK